MTLFEMEQAVVLLAENVERFERISDPTEYEITMYRSLWSTFCYLNGQILLGKAIEETEKNIEKEFDKVSHLSHITAYDNQNQTTPDSGAPYCYHLRQRERRNRNPLPDRDYSGEDD